MTMPTWEDQLPLLIDLAKADLIYNDGVVRPTMIAFRGDEALSLITLREFAAGEHTDAIIEAGAIALGLNATRVMLTMAGRAWSTADPIPPVCEEGDLRQQVLVVHEVTENGHRTHLATITGDEVGEFSVLEGGEGAVPQILGAIVSNATEQEAPPLAFDDVLYQISRCSALGHRVATAPGLLSA